MAANFRKINRRQPEAISENTCASFHSWRWVFTEIKTHGVVHANVGQNVTRAGPSLSFFVPKATYDDLVASREVSHNTTPTGITGKNTSTMVAEPPSSPAMWS
jgi:hypothetical protein